MTAVAAGVVTGPATEAHLPFIETGVRATFAAHAALNRSHFTPDRLRRLLAGLRDGIDGSGATRHHVALLDGRPVGYVTLTRMGGGLLIRDIHVVPELRRHGVAGRLVDHARRQGGSAAARQLVAVVWDGNDASHALFAGAGFRAQVQILPVSISRLFPALRSTTYVLDLGG